MRHRKILLATAFAVGLAGVAYAAADTQYRYYALYGKDAVEILRSIYSRGPTLHGENAIATIKPNFSVDGRLVQKGGTCRVEGFKINHSFLITLPQLRGKEKLEPKTRVIWDKFAAHAKWHEEEHRRIWIGCIKEAERKITSMRAPTCAKLDAAGDKEVTRIFKACEQKHRAFDAKEAKTIARHALVQDALGIVKKREVERQAKIQAAPKMPDWFYEVR